MITKHFLNDFSACVNYSSTANQTITPPPAWSYNSSSRIPLLHHRTNQIMATTSLKINFPPSQHLWTSSFFAAGDHQTWLWPRRYVGQPKNTKNEKDEEGARIDAKVNFLFWERVWLTCSFSRKLEEVRAKWCTRSVGAQIGNEWRAEDGGGNSTLRNNVEYHW